MCLDNAIVWDVFLSLATGKIPQNSSSFQMAFLRQMIQGQRVNSKWEKSLWQTRIAMLQ